MSSYRFSLMIMLLLLAGCAPATMQATTNPSREPETEAAATEPDTPVLRDTPAPMPTPDLTARPLVWFAPLPPMTVNSGRPFTGSDDFINLFNMDAEWQHAAAGIHVFKLYGEWVAYNASDAELKQVVDDLKRRGMALAVEAGPLNATSDCGQGVEGFAGLDEGQLITSRIKLAGGTIDIIALDEPYFFASVYDGPNACHWSAEHIAEGVDKYILAMRQEFPGVIVGDTEPFASSTTPEEYRDWLRTFREVAGYDLAFLHMDFDWSRRDWSQQALQMEQYGHELGIPIGMIYIGNAADPDDETWIATAGERVKRHQIEDGGEPDHILFQSWVDHPDFVLPESDRNSFTGLIRTYLETPGELGWPQRGAGANLALEASVRASGIQAGYPPEAAVDGDTGTWWSAGAGPTQWIEIDLGAEHKIAELILIPSQSPPGRTVHRVLGRGPSSGGEFFLLTTFNEDTRDGEPLRASAGDWPAIRYVRIVTDSSPSWVAWREVQISSSR